MTNRIAIVPLVGGAKDILAPEINGLAWATAPMVAEFVNSKQDSLSDRMGIMKRDGRVAGTKKSAREMRHELQTPNSDHDRTSIMMEVPGYGKFEVSGPAPFYPVDEWNEVLREMRSAFSLKRKQEQFKAFHSETLPVPTVPTPAIDHERIGLEAWRATNDQLEQIRPVLHRQNIERLTQQAEERVLQHQAYQSMVAAHDNRAQVSDNRADAEKARADLAEKQVETLQQRFDDIQPRLPVSAPVRGSRIAWKQAAKTGIDGKSSAYKD